MNKIFEKSLVLMMLVVFQLSGCSDQGKQGPAASKVLSEGQATVKPIKKVYSIADPTYLRSRVPKEALAYIRIPDLFEFTSSPKGDLFTGALISAEHKKMIRHLQVRLNETLANETAGLIKPLGAFWLQHMRSPVELILLSNKHKQPLPRILMTARLGFASRQSFEAFISDLANKEKRLYLMNNTILKDGQAGLASGPVSVELHYDADKGFLRLMAGIGITRADFNTAFDGLTVHKEHLLYQSEEKIDSSHHGLFAWFNMQNVLPVLANTMPPAKLESLKDSILFKARTLAMGMGVSDGKGRLKVMTDFSDDALDKTVPAGKMDLDFISSGVPKIVAGISLTEVGQFKRLEQNLLMTYFGSRQAEYTAIKDKFAKYTGFTAEDMLAALGPEIIFLQDELGEFSLLRVRDAEKYKKLLEQWVGKGKLNHRTFDMKGVRIHHVETVPFWFESIKGLKEKKENPFLKLLLKGKAHTYWIEQDNYLVFAAVPQLLYDRMKYKSRVRIKDWLENTQGQDAASALALLSSSIHGSPTRLYYTYLQTLLFISDLVDAKIEIQQLPSAEDVSLPETGTYGFQLSVAKNRMFAELVYESNPAEFVLGQNMGNVAVVGILAAIAIPAYQDYTLRARVQGSYMQAGRVQRWIESFRLKHNAYPGRDDIDKFDFSGMESENIGRITVIPGSGIIVLTLKGHKILLDKRIALKPGIGGHGIIWKCSGEIPQKYLPRSCR